jgi:flavin reductase (DIM6/NTAB) family NADH-FMN oxidoreductase RutF
MAEDQNAARDFEELIGELDYPMFIVTTRKGEQLAGCLIGFAN